MRDDEAPVGGGPGGEGMGKVEAPGALVRWERRAVTIVLVVVVRVWSVPGGGFVF